MIIVISVIVILAIIALTYFRGQIFKGNDARRKGDFNRIKIALEEYEKDHNCYPPIPPDTVNIMSCNPGTGLRPYLEKIPCDPITHLSYFYEPDPGPCPRWYRVYTKLENDADPVIISGIGPSGAYNYYQGSANSPVITSQMQTPGGTQPGTYSESGYYGCKSGVCVPLSGPVCMPNFASSTCGKSGGGVGCGTPSDPLNECVKP